MPRSSPDAEAAATSALARLRALANPANVAGMARYGISTRGTLGVTVAATRRIARDLRLELPEPARRHRAAALLWRSGVHEARILASLLDDPALVTAAQAERWARDLDSWDVCDQLVNNLLRECPAAEPLGAAWRRREEPFVRRAGFVLLATRAVRLREATTTELGRLLAACERAAGDDRPPVRKAISWALRQVGKQDLRLRRAALAAAARIRAQGSPSARWIASDVIRELENPVQVARIRMRAARRQRLRTGATSPPPARPRRSPAPPSRRGSPRARRHTGRGG